MEILLGKQGVWVDKTDKVGHLNIERRDGKFFKIGMITKDYDRPVIVNFGPARTSVVLVDGKIAVEPETIVANLDGTKIINQNRVLRASFDNPNFSGLPKNDILTGENFLDGQRIIYDDDPVKSFTSTVDAPPQRKTKEGFVDCETISIKELGKTVDAPGKAAVFDVLAKYLTDEEASKILRVISNRIYIEQLK